VKRLVFQGIALGGVVLLGWYLVANTLDNLAARNIASGFAFLRREAGFEIGESAVLAYGAADSYLRALLVGLTNTFKVALAGVLLATALGAVVGISRLSENILLKTLAGAYVEFIRNVPLLVQLFFWYAVIAEALPPPREALQPLPGVFLSSRGIFFPLPGSTPVLEGSTSLAAAISRPSSPRCSSASWSTPVPSSPRSCAPESFRSIAARSRPRRRSGWAAAPRCATSCCRSRCA
jgi:His/Glu/Gln/Arg/opine family amino acid ABC transporter permease subunit